MANMDRPARAALDNGDAEEALRMADRSLRENWEPSARVAGIASFRMQDLREAEGHFTEVTKALPDDALAMYYRGLCRSDWNGPAKP